MKTNEIKIILESFRHLSSITTDKIKNIFNQNLVLQSDEDVKKFILENYNKSITNPIFDSVYQYVNFTENDDYFGPMPNSWGMENGLEDYLPHFYDDEDDDLGIDLEEYSGIYITGVGVKNGKDLFVVIEDLDYGLLSQTTFEWEKIENDIKSELKTILLNYRKINESYKHLENISTDIVKKEISNDYIFETDEDVQEFVAKYGKDFETTTPDGRYVHKKIIELNIFIDLTANEYDEIESFSDFDDATKETFGINKLFLDYEFNYNKGCTIQKYDKDYCSVEVEMVSYEFSDKEKIDYSRLPESVKQQIIEELIKKNFN